MIEFTPLEVHNPARYSCGGPPDTPRPMTLFLRENHPDPMIGVEVGVLEGAHAVSMLSLLNISKFYLVDPYLPYGDLTDLILEKARIKAIRYTREWDDIVEWVYHTSKDAANIVPNELDFVYIDGPHSYSNTYFDINAWYPKVKCGGYIGGHNYGNTKGAVPTVEAVHEFMENIGIEVPGWDYYNKWACTHLPPHCDWWVRKPE